MLNTYGLRSINTATFNLKFHTNYSFPKPLRDIIVTGLRIHNLVLNVLGYIAGVSLVSGCIRMATGLAICLLTLAVGDRDAQQGAIIGHWYDEALLTGVAQIARGAIEAFMPFGRVANLCLDVLGTVVNFVSYVGNASVCQDCMGYQNHGPYADADYPLPMSFLYLV